jgi:hypothetical protein
MHLSSRSFVFDLFIFMFRLHLLKLIKEKCPEVFRMKCTQYAFTTALYYSFPCADTYAFYSTNWVVCHRVLYNVCWCVIVGSHSQSWGYNKHVYCTHTNRHFLDAQGKDAYSQIAALWQIASHCMAVLQYSRSEIRRELLLYFQSIIFTFTYLYVSCGLQLSFL